MHSVKAFYLSFLLFICLFLLSYNSFSQLGEDTLSYSKTNSTKSFEGSIKYMQKYANGDTTYSIYYIKGNMVRMDYYICSDSDESENRLLFDLERETIVALNTKKQSYVNLPIKEYNPSIDKGFCIKKTNNSKQILDYQCSQWRVKNPSQKTEIAFWVIDFDFAFYEKFLKLWNRSEKQFSYYLQIPNTEGFFPVLTVERTTLRDKKMSMEVLSINKESLDNSIFIIPEDYIPYDH